jgi:hypothetical protein
VTASTDRAGAWRTRRLLKEVVFLAGSSHKQPSSSSRPTDPDRPFHSGPRSLLPLFSRASLLFPRHCYRSPSSIFESAGFNHQDRSQNIAIAKNISTCKNVWFGDHRLTASVSACRINPPLLLNATHLPPLPTSQFSAGRSPSPDFRRLVFARENCLDSEFRRVLRYPPRLALSAASLPNIPHTNLFRQSLLHAHATGLNLLNQQVPRWSSGNSNPPIRRRLDVSSTICLSMAATRCVDSLVLLPRPSL